MVNFPGRIIEQGGERGPHGGGERDTVTELTEGYHARGRVEVLTRDDIAADLMERIGRGEITEEQANEVAATLRLFEDQ